MNRDQENREPIRKRSKTEVGEGLGNKNNPAGEESRKQGGGIITFPAYHPSIILSSSIRIHMLVAWLWRKPADAQLEVKARGKVGILRKKIENGKANGFLSCDLRREGESPRDLSSCLLFILWKNIEFQFSPRFIFRFLRLDFSFLAWRREKAGRRSGRESRAGVSESFDL